MKQIIKNNKKIIILNLILIIVINLSTNYNYIISLFNQTSPITYDNTNITIDETNSTYKIKNINKNINIIEIQFDSIPETIDISYKNKNFKNYKHINDNYYNEFIQKDKLIIPTSMNEPIKDLKFKIEEGNINKIVLNPKFKYNLNIYKTFFIIFIINFTIYLLTKKEKLNLKDFKQSYLLYLTLIILIFFCIIQYNTFTKNNDIFGDLYEYYYTNSIIDKKLELDFPISEELKNAKNPYDPSNRDYTFLWDASYYKGKYYCYFGLWPILTLMAPFKIITTKYLTTPLVCLFYAIISIISTLLLYNSTIKKYFKNITFQTYILSFIFIIFGSKILWCMNRPSFYELVSLASYAHIILGLYLVIFSNNKVKNFIGYTLLATAVLCRPTTLFCSVLILPKILNNIKIKNFKLIDLIILIVPYLIVGIFTMYINYIRFDSIFEFGISYQLTTNNLNSYSFSIINSIFGILNYLFGNINITFLPFNIISPKPNLPVLTDFHIENFGGGVITTSILGLIIFFIPLIFKHIKEKELKIYIILSLSTALFMIIFSSGIGALIGRYMLDFNYIFYFISVILSLYILKINNKNQKLNNIYNIIMLISIFINLVLTFTNIK